MRWIEPSGAMGSFFLTYSLRATLFSSESDMV
jgi:hypothetical protein